MLAQENICLVCSAADGTSDAQLVPGRLLLTTWRMVFVGSDAATLRYVALSKVGSVTKEGKKEDATEE